MDSKTPNLLRSIILSQSRIGHINAHFYLLQKITLEKLNISTIYEIIGFAEARSAVTCLQVDSIENRYLLSGSADGMFAIYDLEKWRDINGKRVISPMDLRVGSNSMISKVEWYPHDSGMFSTCDFSGFLQVYDANNTEEAVIRTSFTSGPIYSSSFCPANSLIAATSNDGQVFLFDLQLGEVSDSVHGHSAATTAVSWNPSKQFELLSTSKDGTVKVWDVRRFDSRSPLLTLDWLQDGSPDISKTLLARAHDKEVMSACYSPCGRYIISSGNDKQIRLWHSDTANLCPRNFGVGKATSLPYQMDSFQLQSALNRSETFVIFYTDGKSLGQTSSSLGEISLLPLTSPSPAPSQRLVGHFDRITAVVHRKATQTLISSGSDGLIHIWDASASQKAEREETRVNKKRPYAVEEDSEMLRSAPLARKKFIAPILGQYLDEIIALGSAKRPTKSALMSPSASAQLPFRGNSIKDWDQVDELFDEEE
jgi:WD40 repeat protein